MVQRNHKYQPVCKNPLTGNHPNKQKIIAMNKEGLLSGRRLAAFQRRQNKLILEKMAKTFGIYDKNLSRN